MNANIRTPLRYRIAVFFFMLFFYVCSYSISGFYGNTVFAILTIVFSTMLIVVNRKMQVNSTKLIVFLALTIVILFRNYDIANFDYYTEVVFISLLMIWLIPPKYKWYDIVIKILEIMGVVFTATTILFYFSPGLYESYIGIVYPKEAYLLLLNYRKGYMFGLTKNSAFNSAYILYALAINLIRIIYSRYSKSNKYRILYLVIQIIALFLTVKRSAILFGTLAILGMYLIKSNKRGKFVKSISIICIIVLLLTVAAQFVPGISTALDKTLTQGSEGDISNGRFLRFKLTWNLFKANPILGIGWGGMRETFTGSQSVSTDSAHNIYLQLLAETGIIGFIVFLIFFIDNIVKCVRFSKIASTNQEENIHIGFCLFTQLYFLMYGVSGNPLYDIVFFMMYLFSCIYVESQLSWENQI